MKYTVIYEKGPTSWGAYVPDLPGVITVGDSCDDVERLIPETIELHLEAQEAIARDPFFERVRQSVFDTRANVGRFQRIARAHGMEDRRALPRFCRQACHDH